MPMSPGPGVSVVIPTVGRPELARAIDSVRRQDYDGPIELIVVGDLPPGSLAHELVERADVVLYTGGGRRGGAARNIGIAAASQPFIALLDDDDEWKPWKLSVQIPVFDEKGADIVGTQAVYRNAATGTTSAPVPTVVKPDDQSFVEYVFRRRGTRVGRPVIFGITLVVRTDLARRVPWDESLKRHQDWDWVDRMERDGARIVQIADPSAVVWTGSDGSVTSSPDWESSLAWAATLQGRWKPEILADFLAGQPLRYAIQARSIKGVYRTARAIGRTRRVPSLPTLLLGFGGLVPRSVINKLMTRNG